MYPALPRWSDANVGALPTTQRLSRPSLPPRAPLPQTEVSSSSPDALLPAPNTRASPATGAARTRKTGHNGQVFVDHNAAPVSAAPPPPPATGSSATSPSTAAAAAVFPPSTSAMTSSPGGHGVYRGSVGGGQASAPTPPYNGTRPTYSTNWRGVVRGTTVANSVEARRVSDTPPLLLSVAGVQTGEEVLVDGATAAARRRSCTNHGHHHNYAGNDSSPTCKNPQDHVQMPQFKRQLDKANASVKALTAAGRRQQQEHDAQKAMWAVQLDEWEARLRAELGHCGDREKLLSQYASELAKRHSSAMQKMKQLQQSAMEAHRTERVRWETELTSLRRECEAAKAAADARTTNDSVVAPHQSEMERLKAELEGLRRISAERQLELETSLVNTQSALNRTTTELQEYQQVQQQCNYLVQQCHLFIRQVCQPGFSVVKGPSLEPVEKNRPEPTGFVLVPLTVLLHGYALLPEDDRQEVIDHYDKEAKALH